MRIRTWRGLAFSLCWSTFALVSWILLPCELNAQTPTVDSVVNSASLSPDAVVAGSSGSVLGSNLGPSSPEAASYPLPTSLGGTTVLMAGIAVPLIAVSLSKIEMQVPWELASLTQVSLTVTTDSGTSSPVTVNLAAFGPGIFDASDFPLHSETGSKSGAGFIILGGNGLVSESNPALPGAFVSIFATGLGPVTNTPPSGEVPSGSPVSFTTEAPTVTIGGLLARVFTSVLAPGFVTLYQVDVEVPENVTLDIAVPVVITIGGVSSNTVTMATQVGPGQIPATLSLVSGDSQTGTVGEALANPFVVKVTDDNGNPVAGVPVTFPVAAGGGTLSATQVTTDSQGLASSTLTLGPNPGVNTVIAVSGTLTGSPVTFTATGISDLTSPILPPNSVVNSASFRPATDPNGAITLGAIVAIFGTDMASSTEVASAVPLPTTLGNTSVTFNDIPAPLFFVAATQINAQVPFDVLPGEVSVQVQRGSETSATQTVSVAAVSPGIFALNQQGTGQGAVLIANSAIFAAPSGSIPGQEARPANHLEFISIFCSGLRDVTNRPPNGAPPSGGGLSVTLETPTATIGGVEVPVSFSGLTSFVGLYQVNVQVPSNAPTGEAVPVVLSIGGVDSNTVTIALQ